MKDTLCTPSKGCLFMLALFPLGLHWKSIVWPRQDARDEAGWSALHTESWLCNDEGVQRFVYRGANVEASDNVRVALKLALYPSFLPLKGSSEPHHTSNQSCFPRRAGSVHCTRLRSKVAIQQYYCCSLREPWLTPAIAMDIRHCAWQPNTGTKEQQLF